MGSMLQLPIQRVVSLDDTSPGQFRPVRRNSSCLESCCICTQSWQAEWSETDARVIAGIVISLGVVNTSRLHRLVHTEDGLKSVYSS